MTPDLLAALVVLAIIGLWAAALDLDRRRREEARTNDAPRELE